MIAGWLHDVILRPIEPALSASSIVAFVPDATLRGIPFAALYDTRRDRFLIEDSAVAEAPSVTVTVAASRRAGIGRTEAVLAIGASATSVLGPLPGAEREAHEVARLRPNSLALTGQQATPLTLMTLAPRYAVVHIAGHGTAGRTPADATLVLADDGHGNALTARDIASLSLPATRLVVLTACRTSAPGERGDGPESVAAAFLLAGVPSVIGSAWPLLDDAAARFAERFHRALLDCGDPGAALRRAVQPRDTTGRPLGPADWAGFSLIGGSTTLIDSRERSNDHEETKSVDRSGRLGMSRRM